MFYYSIPQQTSKGWKSVVTRQTDGFPVLILEYATKKRLQEKIKEHKKENKF